MLTQQKSEPRKFIQFGLTWTETLPENEKPRIPLGIKYVMLRMWMEFLEHILAWGMKLLKRGNPHSNSKIFSSSQDLTTYEL